MWQPRLRACSRSSSTRIPAPSPRTKPSRSLSKGRLASAGESLRIDRARSALKHATTNGLINASEPPAIMTSASFRAMKRDASPMACAPAAHAVVAHARGPRAPARVGEGGPAASNLVMRRTPLTPSLSCLQKGSTPIPMGETTPRPVTTTRLIWGSTTLQLSCASRRSRELAPPQLQDPVSCQETLDQRGVEDAIAYELEPRGRDPDPSQLG